jgi:hypothetical protein
MFRRSVREEMLQNAWNIGAFRERERRWRLEAECLSPGAERNACISLADGYAYVIDLIEKSEAEMLKYRSWPACLLP